VVKRGGRRDQLCGVGAAFALLPFLVGSAVTRLGTCAEQVLDDVTDLPVGFSGHGDLRPEVL
jgi:hypothetical protein